ncbi:MAG TPA: hypothetical protein VFM79_09510, partial [Pelobium sp.]|nr:hypothetical protein [Pelobium sp.]
NFQLENANITSKKLFSAHDATNITIKNAIIHSADSNINLIDVRDLTFENVRFEVPGDEIITNISGKLSNDIQFKNTDPKKPKGWVNKYWRK